MSGLGNLTLNEMVFIGIVLEGFCYGLYSAIFFMYIQYEASKEFGIDKRNVLYALCILYILSVITVALDLTRFTLAVRYMGPSGPSSLLLQFLHFSYVSTTINGLCDFISQAILIYRCWVIWSHNGRVIIIPSILAFIFLATWLASNGSIYVAPADEPVTQTHWGHTVTLTSLTISLTVNAVVTGLIIFRLLKVSQELGLTFCHRPSGIGKTEEKVRSIIFILIESGMAMFAIQSIRVVLSILDVNAVKLIIGTNQMLNGLTPTLILMRVSMGLSFHDEKSISDIVGSFQFGQDSMPDTAVVEVVGLDRIGGIQQGDDIEFADK